MSAASADGESTRDSARELSRGRDGSGGIAGRGESNRGTDAPEQQPRRAVRFEFGGDGEGGGGGGGGGNRLMEEPEREGRGGGGPRRPGMSGGDDSSSSSSSDEENHRGNRGHIEHSQA